MIGESVAVASFLACGVDSRDSHYPFTPQEQPNFDEVTKFRVAAGFRAVSKIKFGGVVRGWRKRRRTGCLA